MAFSRFCRLTRIVLHSLTQRGGGNKWSHRKQTVMFCVSGSCDTELFVRTCCSAPSPGRGRCSYSPRRALGTLTELLLCQNYLEAMWGTNISRFPWARPLAWLTISKSCWHFTCWYLGKDAFGYVVECVVTSELTPPLAPPPCVSRSESNSTLVCWRSLEMSTFSCIPKTSGCWLNGSSYNTKQGFVTQLDIQCIYKIGTIFKCICVKCLYLDKFNVVLIDRFRWGMVFTTRGERVAMFLNDILVVEVGQDGHQETSIPVVCHTASIVTLPGQVHYGLEGHFIVLVHKQLRRKIDYISDSCNGSNCSQSLFEWIPVAVGCLYAGRTRWSHREYSSPVDQTSFSPEQVHGRSTVHTGAFPKSSGEIQGSENIHCVMHLLNDEM